MSENLSKENLLDEIRRLAEELDKTPTSIDMRENGEHHPSTYQTHFRSWSAAVEEAGFEPNHGTKISTSDLINDIQRVASDLGRCPSSSEIRDYGEFSYPTYHNRFGSWTSAIEAARDYTPSVGNASEDNDDPSAHVVDSPQSISMDKIAFDEEAVDELVENAVAALRNTRNGYQHVGLDTYQLYLSVSIKPIPSLNDTDHESSEEDDDQDGDHR